MRFDTKAQEVTIPQFYGFLIGLDTFRHISIFSWISPRDIFLRIAPSISVVSTGPQGPPPFLS